MIPRAGRRWWPGKHAGSWKRTHGPWPQPRLSVGCAWGPVRSRVQLGTGERHALARRPRRTMTTEDSVANSGTNVATRPITNGSDRQFLLQNKNRISVSDVGTVLSWERGRAQSYRKVDRDHEPQARGRVPCPCQARGSVSRRPGSPAAEPGPGSAPMVADGPGTAGSEPARAGDVVPNTRPHGETFAPRFAPAGRERLSWRAPTPRQPCGQGAAPRAPADSPSGKFTAQDPACVCLTPFLPKHIRHVDLGCSQSL